MSDGRSTSQSPRSALAAETAERSLLWLESSGSGGGGGGREFLDGRRGVDGEGFLKGLLGGRGGGDKGDRRDLVVGFGGEGFDVGGSRRNGGGGGERRGDDRRGRVEEDLKGRNGGLRLEGRCLGGGRKVRRESVDSSRWKRRGREDELRREKTYANVPEAFRLVSDPAVFELGTDVPHDLPSLLHAATDRIRPGPSDGLRDAEFLQALALLLACCCSRRSASLKGDVLLERLPLLVVVAEDGEG
jgi:hypothetical protein